MIKQAVIFCGGFGKRLQKITSKIPKPMVDVAENLFGTFDNSIKKCIKK